MPGEWRALRGRRLTLSAARRGRCRPGRRASASAARTTSLGTPKPPRLRRRRRSRRTPSSPRGRRRRPSGPPELPSRTRAAQRGDRCGAPARGRRRPAVLTVRVVAQARGRDVVGAVLRVAEHRARAARPRVGDEPQGGRVEARRRAARRCRCVGSKWIGLRVEPGRRRRPPGRRVVGAGHDVRVGHHDARSRATQPEPCDPQPARRAQDPHDAAARAPGPAGRARSPSRGGPHVDRRARRCCGNGSKRAERVEDRARGRQRVVERAAGPPSAGRRGGARGSWVLWSATAPPIQAIPSATQPVSAAPRAPSTTSSPRRARAGGAAPSADALEAGGQDRRPRRAPPTRPNSGA